MGVPFFSHWFVWCDYPSLMRWERKKGSLPRHLFSFRPFDASYCFSNIFFPFLIFWQLGDIVFSIAQSDFFKLLF
jgi:hypothetical protein